MNRLDRPFRHLTTVGAIALALLLAGCGLKGSLDPPPTPAQQAQLDGKPPEGQQPPPDSEQPQPARKRIFLDWLLD